MDSQLLSSQKLIFEFSTLIELRAKDSRTVRIKEENIEFNEKGF